MVVQIEDHWTARWSTLNVGSVDKRDSLRSVGVIQTGICNGDQLGTRPDVGRGMEVILTVHPDSPRPERTQTYQPPPCSRWDFLDRAHGLFLARSV